MNKTEKIKEYLKESLFYESIGYEQKMLKEFAEDVREDNIDDMISGTSNEYSLLNEEKIQKIIKSEFLMQFDEAEGDSIEQLMIDVLCLYNRELLKDFAEEVLEIKI